MIVMELDEQQFSFEVIKSSVPVLVEFYATWCAPCKIMAPILEEVAQETGKKARVVKMDIERASALAAQYHVMSVPTLLLIANGQVLRQWRGAKSKNELVNTIASL
ncbi:MAG: thioredoxin [Deltaproteobacteria bacterium RIFCSPLOWO2_02_FULL_46_8]|nr:MAG: thioredoxin [Deltaproteobacteria bacterium RIFCSPLOWO2_02_FULL_46_8]